ncbi:MAG TPA: hypothetical protein VJS14_08145 [Enterobacteriaceae bacterium]|nr:hypothetical protein [Enterobacteriaceae bacterium]
MKIRIAMGGLLALATLPGLAVPPETDAEHPDNEQCAWVLDTLVSTSSLPLLVTSGIDPSSVRADIDRREGQRLIAQVSFPVTPDPETPGAGQLGWVQYDPDSGVLEDITTDPKKPEALDFDRRYVQLYAGCLQQKPMYSVIGKGRLTFYQNPELTNPVPGVFILPDEPVRWLVAKESAARVRYQSRDGRIYLGWVPASRLKVIDFKRSSARRSWKNE